MSGGRHRQARDAGRHRQQPAGARHRGAVRPRYGRIAVAFSALSITAVAVLGNFGFLKGMDPQLASASVDQGANTDADGTLDTVGADDPITPDADTEREKAERSEPHRLTSKKHDVTGATEVAALPADSGDGRRVVFSETEQRVWLVAASGRVERTYLVSGSVYDNLEPGTYSVYSRSEDAVGIDDSGTMKYFVRFTQGDEGAAIGFHTIPVDDGAPVQTRAELGTPLSHGCIRQAAGDAIALWRFAPLGTTVVVTA